MNLLKIFGIVLVSLLSLVSIAYAVPTGPSNINVISSSRYPVSSASNLSAIAGNVTEVNFISHAVTQTWQGYFGNASGTVLLGNSNNQTLYDWSQASPSGEIYATRSVSTPTWANIRCANVTNIDDEDTALGVNQSTDQDSVNKTFLNTTTFPQFYVGSININTTQSCYATALRNTTGISQSFKEVLLHDNAMMIYTALLTQDSLGFDGSTHDFEMLVGENGHLGDTSPTPYYFYLELQ